MSWFARPTVYRSIKFRSRLEARFAALFDLIDWAWEYEPEIIGAYIPDFLIHGTNGRQVYVEVKSPSDYRENRLAITEKAIAAIGEDAEFLVLTGEFQSDGQWDCSPVFGYMPSRDIDYETDRPIWEDDHARLFRPGRDYGLEYDFAPSLGSWRGRLSGAYDGNALFEGNLVPIRSLRYLWSRAGNMVQWKP